MWRLLVLLPLLLPTASATKQLPELFMTTFTTLLQRHYDDCVHEIGIGPEVPSKIFADLNWPKDPKLKCFFKCIHDHLEFSSNGIFDHDRILLDLKMPDDKLINDCLEKTYKADDFCERAFIMTKCIAVGAAVDV
ncbi:hypothetical protein PPYR_09171 [Photinus pyralis]|uniref:Uncharacterized protein n=1 Tax=Photinus pyralis TaxID=7054 RepID=A0A1Y1L1S4_PHOPY|nr:hypothetical protein PPYR_09171 [Photinus pyralis]